jgi:hypothetical protein
VLSDDPSIAVADFARDYLAGSSAKIARRIIEAEIPHQKLKGRILLKKSAADAWRDAQTITPALPDLKSLLDEIAARELAKRKAS